VIFWTCFSIEYVYFVLEDLKVSLIERLSYFDFKTKRAKIYWYDCEYVLV